MQKVLLTHNNVMFRANHIATLLKDHFHTNAIRVYPIPRGGIPVAYLLRQYGFIVVDNAHEADLFVDDIIGSGATRERMRDQFPNTPFAALIDKRDVSDPYFGKWVIFPWEETAEVGIEDHICRMIEFAGDDPKREGLLETPNRVAKAMQHWFSGYGKNPADILKAFKDGGEKYDQMVTVKDIPIYSFCEHHIAPIFGTVTISYIPNGKIIGLSKLSRLADIFARRLQVQERLTDEIADALNEHLKPKGVGVMLRARHMCMESRGICQQGHHTVTTALRGVILTEASAKAEFLELAR